jgi:hypothetical protein
MILLFKRIFSFFKLKSHHTPLQLKSANSTSEIYSRKSRSLPVNYFWQQRPGV